MSNYDYENSHELSVLINKNLNIKNQDSLMAELDNLPYSIQHIKIIIMTGLVLLMQGFEVNLISFLFLPLRESFQVDSFVFQLISAIVFVGVGLGSLFLGYLKNKFGRKRCCFTSLLVILFFHLVYTLEITPFVFALSRFIIGFCFGIVSHISFNILCESLPNKNKTFILTSIWISVSFGTLLLLLLIFIIMPYFEMDKLKNLFLALWFIISIITYWYFALFSDSFRNLIFTNKLDDAFICYNKLCNIDNLNIDRNNITKYHLYSIEESFYLDLFNSCYLATTIKLILIWIINSSITNGFLIIFSLTLDSLYPNNNLSIITYSVLSSLTLILGGLVSAFLSESKVFGLRRTLILTYILSFLSSISLVIKFDYFKVFIFPFLLFDSVGFYLVAVFSGLSYETKLRDTGTGVLGFCSKVGGFLAQFIFLILFRLNMLYPYYLIVFLVMTLVILIYSLDDIDSNHEIYVNKEKIDEDKIELIY
jgi:MFS family permease